MQEVEKARQRLAEIRPAVAEKIMRKWAQLGCD